MSTTTFAQAWTKTGAAIKVLDQAYKALGVNASNFVDLTQAYLTTAQFEGRQASQSLNAFLKLRDQLRSVIKSPTEPFNPGLALIARAQSPGPASSRTDVPGQLADAYVYMAQASPVECVTSRGFVRGTFANGSPFVGNTTFKRVWLDPYGFPSQVGWPETVIVKCVADQNSAGVPFKGQERWQLEGQPFEDELQWEYTGFGSGLFTTVSAASADTSLLANPSFGTVPSGGDATPNGTATLLGVIYGSIAGWLVNGGLVGDGSDIIVDRVTYYQEAQNENGSPGALRFKLSKTIFQPLRGAFSNNIPVLVDRPYYVGTKIKADGNGQWTGTVAITLGSKTWTKTITNQTGWIDVGPDANDAVFNQTDLWYQNWGQTGANNFQIAVTKTSGATTYLLVDRAMLQPMNPIIDPNTNGTMYWLLPLSGNVDAVARDTGSFADTTTDLTIPAVLGQWSHRTWGASWPCRPAAPISAPTVVLSATAGSVTTGTHVVAVAFVDKDGIEGPLGAASGSVTGDNAHNVDVTAIALGGTDCAKRKLYMTKAGTVTPFFYAGITINDNVTTTATGASGITTNDAGLTIAPQTITRPEP